MDKIGGQRHGYQPASPRLSPRRDWRKPPVGPMQLLGANVGAIQTNDFPRQENQSGQAGGDHASSRTGPDSAQRLTCICKVR